jgi:hypothetical protein
MTRQREELPGQLTLDGLDTPPVRVRAARPTRRSAARSIAYARCPYGSHTRLTGVVYDNDCRLVFRDHLIRFTSGAALVCRGSGQPVPDKYTVYEG